MGGAKHLLPFGDVPGPTREAVAVRRPLRSVPSRPSPPPPFPSAPPSSSRPPAFASIVSSCQPASQPEGRSSPPPLASTHRMPEQEVHTKLPTVMSVYVGPRWSQSKHLRLGGRLLISLSSFRCFSSCFLLALAAIAPELRETQRPGPLSPTGRRRRRQEREAGPVPLKLEARGRGRGTREGKAWARRAYARAHGTGRPTDEWKGGEGAALGTQSRARGGCVTDLGGTCATPFPRRDKERSATGLATGRARTPRAPSSAPLRPGGSAAARVAPEEMPPVYLA